ncbi:MAG: FAD-dependent oxidoreductase [Anaerolineales bacterium]|nr:FAD-dependent oxidoreductase [Anaerolineales bacterium]
MEDRKIRHAVAVIGAGPAGIFASGELAKTGIQIALINRDIKPGGLAEYGIYHNKYKLKDGLRSQFVRLLEAPNIHYYGNFSIGNHQDISIRQLKELGFSAVLITAGAQGTKYLDLPGENQSGVYHAKEIVYHYNGLPPYSQQRYPVGKTAIIIGMGNVMADIASWLIHDVRVENVIVVGRRGPAEVKFSNIEWRDVASNLDLVSFEEEYQSCIPIMEAVGQDVEEHRSFLLNEVGKACDGDSPARLTIDFFASPSRILSDTSGKVTGLEVEETILELTPNDETRSIRTGNFKKIPADTVIFSIGDRVDPDFGLPLDRNSFATHPRPLFPVDNTSYESYDFQTGESRPGCFISGWARDASSGKVGNARKDGANAAMAIMQYLDTLARPSSPEQVLMNLDAAINTLEKRIITKEDWLKILAEEARISKKTGQEHFIFTTNDQMLAVLK